MKLDRMIVVASLGLAACTHSPTRAAPPVQKEIAMTQQDEAAKRARMNYQPVKWPLKFKRHNFDARCYDTQECHIWYNQFDFGDDKSSPPSYTYGPGYLDNWRGGHAGIRNFPPPAEVTWRSRDGTEHRTEIDIGAIFRDELIRHNMSREEISKVPDGRLVHDPDILVEVNYRIIRVYMRMHIPTRQLQNPGNPYSDFRNDLILVQTAIY